MGSFPCCEKKNQTADKNKVINVFDIQDIGKKILLIYYYFFLRKEFPKYSKTE